MLARDLLDAWSHLDSPLHRLDARVKVVCGLGLVAGVLALPLRSTALLGAYAGMLVVLCALSRLPWGWMGRRLLVLTPFLALGAVAVMFVPPAEATDARRLGGLVLSRQALAVWTSAGGKCLLALLAATLLTGTTNTADLIRAGQALRIPRTLTALAGLALTSLGVLGDELARMVTASRCRGHVRGTWRRLTTMVSVLRTAMARAAERSERVALAMVARGYRGEIPQLTRSPVPAAHLAAGAGFMALTAAVLGAGLSL
ncbi:MAG: energy-coupling factor transporter transmembrane component T [Armatimonadota bacterium]|nr:energy-coupling factor transporter transmembrane component T [Armatimonadota bacterium]